MIKIRNMLIVSSIVMIVILIVSSVITAFSYNLILGAVSSIDRNKARVSSIQGIKTNISDQQKILSNSIISLDSSKKAEFDKLNASAAEIIKGMLQQKEKMAEKDSKDLALLADINSKLGKAFNEGVYPAIEESKKNKPGEALKNYQVKGKGLLEAEQALKDSVSMRIDYHIKDYISALSELNRLTAENSSSMASVAEGLAKLNEELETLKDNVKGSIEDKKAEELQIRAEELFKGLIRLQGTVGSGVQSSAGIQAILDKIDLKRIKNDITALTNINRLIYWTQRKSFSLAEAVAMLDEKSTGYNEASENAKSHITYLEGLVFGLEAKMLEDISAANAEADKNAEEVFNEIKLSKTLKLPDMYKTADSFNLQAREIADRLDKSFRQYLDIDIDKSHKKQAEIVILLASIIIISLIVGMLLSYMLYNLLAPIRNITSLLGRAEEGDLTVRAPVSRKDEIGELGEKVNRVLDGQQRIVGQVATATKDISSLRQKLKEIFSSSSDSADRISKGLKNVVETVKNGASNIEGSKSEVIQLNTGVKCVSQSTEKAVNDGIKAIEVAFTGEKSVEEAEEVIMRVTDTVQKMSVTIAMLEESSGKIGEITNTIRDIASRTNLLALNAAIEASRAGQQGKGFAVLADEIRKLAEGSNRAAGDIKKQIAEIQDRIKLTVDSMNLGVQGVEEGVSKINRVKSSINEIIESVKSVVDSIKLTSEEACKQTSTAQELAKAVDSMSKAAAEAAGTGENIDSSIEEHLKIIKDMEHLSGKLDEASDKLGSVLGQYKV